LLSHPEQAVELAQNARRKVTDRYSFQAMTDRFQKFYRAICVEQPAEGGIWRSAVPWGTRRDRRPLRPQSPC
jgi:hypothetical protein